MRSGSRKSGPRPRELAAWQLRALAVVARSGLAEEAVFGGGAALAAFHLHHRRSEDLDFFVARELQPADIAPIARALHTRITTTELVVVGPRTSLVLLRGSVHVGRLDFAFYPFDPVGRRTRWRGLTVESLEDMTVNKLQAVLTRYQARDFVDLYFLLREGPLRDLDALLDLVRAKFHAAPHRLGLAARLLLARDLVELPRMLRRVSRAAIVEFFEAKTRALARSE